MAAPPAVLRAVTIPFPDWGMFAAVMIWPPMGRSKRSSLSRSDGEGDHPKGGGGVSTLTIGPF